MNKKTKDKQTINTTIALNRKARHDYFIEQSYEAGIALEGWEVKSLRAGRLNLSESYVLLKGGEAWLLGAHITPLNSASTHVQPEATRTRKLLLKHDEINKLIGCVERQGYTIVPLRMYWKSGLAKLEIALAKGKKQYDKRATIKEREWKIEKARMHKKFK